MPLELVGSAVREALGEMFEKGVQFLLPDGVLPGAQHGHRVIPRPDGTAWAGVTVVDRDLRLSEYGLDPRDEFIAFGHGIRIAPALVFR